MYLGLSWEAWNALALGLVTAAALATPLTSLLRSTYGAVHGVGAVVTAAMRELSTTVEGRLDPARLAIRRGSAAGEPLILLVDATCARLAGRTRSHRSHVVQSVFPEEGLRVWRMGGAVLYGALLALFVYADVSISANNFGALFAEGAVPAVLRGLLVPLLAASAGTAIALGIVAADLAERTHFAPWHTGRRARVALLSLCASLLAVTLLLAIAFGLTRLTGIRGLDLSAATEARIEWVAALSQVVIIAPMIVTTLLLWWGAAAFVVAYVVVLMVTEISLGAVSLLLHLVKGLVPLAGRMVAAGLGVMAAVVRFTLATIMVAVSLVDAAVAGIVGVAQAVLDLVAWPGVQVARAVGGLAARDRGSVVGTASLGAVRPADSVVTRSIEAAIAHPGGESRTGWRVLAPAAPAAEPEAPRAEAARSRPRRAAAKPSAETS